MIDTDTVNVTGAGTPASPFTLDAKVSADADNLLESRPNGLYAPEAFANTQSYTPAWTAALGPAPVLVGNINGDFVDLGSVMFLRIVLEAQFGTDFKTGVGAYFLAMPSGFVTPFTIVPLEVRLIINGMTSYVAMANVQAGLIVVQVLDDSAAAAHTWTAWNDTVPVVPSSVYLTVSGLVVLAP